MMMEPIRDNLHAAEVATQFFYTATLTDDQREAIKPFIFEPSIFTKVTKTCEYLYAHRDEINDEARVLCAQLASFAAQNGWSELGHNNRGGLIHQAMARDLGRKLLPGQPKPQAAKNDPEPSVEFAHNSVVTPIAPLLAAQDIPLATDHLT
jgi:hypothetical protein